ncbi:uncharacterized protein LOC27206937 [Drosophila simulans]|uniref:Uncharacterized protein n=1 Tax=Drosophila simulans TaxID=7240 RepID=A0A0J9RPJ9_DROSI|nr:uncharacterized protein LOC27206937 [Drosophila simulans]KMY97314.1 uncharacterized protein Dsimw501_GD27087 [Drosophila simulans]
MRNNQADNTQRQKLGLERKRQWQRRVWELTMAVATLVALVKRVITSKHQKWHSKLCGKRSNCKIYCHNILKNKLFHPFWRS